MRTANRLTPFTLGWQNWGFLAVVLVILLALTGYVAWVTSHL